MKINGVEYVEADEFVKIIDAKFGGYNKRKDVFFVKLSQKRELAFSRNSRLILQLQKIKGSWKVLAGAVELQQPVLQKEEKLYLPLEEVLQKLYIGRYRQEGGRKYA